MSVEFLVTSRRASSLSRNPSDVHSERPDGEIQPLAVELCSCDDRSFAVMSAIILRGGVEVQNPLELALEFLAAYSGYEAYDSSSPASFDESDLRLANRGGARISAVEIAAILERRGEIERALRKVHPDASLADPTGSIPWIPLTRLFDAFADIRGVGFAKMTKALHRKRPALIPILDSVVHAYLTRDDPGTRASRSFGECATELVRSYKRDLDRNRSVLQELQRELARRRYRLTEVRILDLLIWSLRPRPERPYRLSSCPYAPGELRGSEETKTLALLTRVRWSLPGPTRGGWPNVRARYTLRRLGSRNAATGDRRHADADGERSDR